ncbi:branched-chain amino acid ABC transporter permease [Hippea maritima]|uniref:ABC-type transporter, integral membrane subunit n=1 Tax=Hippea maritima (strain ATCC 700847 / DSM 10411 / MH2) TaxID=760142 RepID=F2LX50_HIPMA|nr:branched-chain amino acid ABC transporter permease [Hippea maritima]AEA33108.1 ABC-type transporter, integral membrane subunit [Hippea maritima DSM 10411]
MSLSRNSILTIISILLLFTFVWYANNNLTPYAVRIWENTAIFLMLAASYNLINGVTGQFSLEPNGFVAIGAYVAAILTLTPDQKDAMFIIEPMVPWLKNIHMSFLPSLIIAGLVTAFVGFLLGFPVFRVRGDYLAIVTLGFGLTIRVISNNTITITNGALGLKGIASYTNIWWCFGWAILSMIIIMRIVYSAFGRAMKAIRDDEDAAIAMGINTFWIKMAAFVIAAFFEGVGGGLLAHLITTISPTMFTFFLTFQLLIIIVVGGLGSMTGTVMATILVIWGSEILRFVEQPMNIAGLHIPGIPGMRMVIFSILLIVIMIFAREGIMGQREFSWNWLFSIFKKSKSEA